jgi:hypothetical protein
MVSPINILELLIPPRTEQFAAGVVCTLGCTSPFIIGSPTVVWAASGPAPIANAELSTVARNA